MCALVRLTPSGAVSRRGQRYRLGAAPRSTARQPLGPALPQGSSNSAALPRRGLPGTATPPNESAPSTVVCIARCVRCIVIHNLVLDLKTPTIHWTTSESICRSRLAGIPRAAQGLAPPEFTDRAVSENGRHLAPMRNSRSPRVLGRAGLERATPSVNKAGVRTPGLQAEPRGC
jgi:hypothetical protein